MIEAKTSSKQTHGRLVPPLVRFVRSNTLLVGVISIEAAYFLSSMIDGTMLIRTVLAFPAAFILPGFVLRLLASKSNLEDIPSLIVESFVISTIVNVVTLSLLILLNAQHYYFLLPLSQLLLVVFVVVLMKAKNDLPKLSIDKVDGLIILTCIVAYLVAVTFYCLTPRLPTPDETSYIASARYALLNGEVYDVSAGSATSAFTYLIKGRFFWTLLTASFLASASLEPCFSHLLSPMFLAMIPLASLPLLPETLRRKGIPRFSLTIVLLTNPLLFYFSGFILNDLAVAFYITFALALFVNSFRQNSLGESIHFSKLVLCFSVLFLAMVFIKTNMAIFFPMYAILLFFALRRETRGVYRRFGYVLLTLPIVYELLIDVPFNLFNWFLKNELLAQLFRRFLWVSPLEYFLGFFVARPWKSTTVFSHNLPQYLQLFYTVISPEVLGLILASIALAAPLALTLKWVRRDQKMVILSILLTITFPIEYFLILSNYSIWDAPRWCLFLLPMIVVFSLAILTRETDNYNVRALFMFCIPAVLFLWILTFLSVQVGGVYFYYSYGTSLLNWTISIVASQLIIYGLVLSLMSVKRTASISVRVPVPLAKLNRVKNLSFSKIMYLTLIYSIIIQNVYVSIFCVKNSSFFGYGHELEDTDRFLTSVSNSSMIFSNTYIYTRTYVSDNVLVESRLFPPPKTENEFLQLLDFAPNGSLIFISTDPEVAWREDANNYIKKYADRDVITSNMSNAYARRIKNEQLSTGQISLFRTVNSPTSNGKSSQITVNDTRLVRLSKKEKALELDISSSAPGYIKIIIGTDHFIELYNTTLSSGNNIVKLEGGSRWQQWTKVRVFIENQNGEVIYNEKVEMFNLEDIQLSSTLIFFSILLVVLLPTTRSKPMYVHAYSAREIVAGNDSTETCKLAFVLVTII